MADRDVLDALSAELEEGERELAEALAGLVAPDANSMSIAKEGERYGEYLHRFASAAEMFDLPALKELAGFFASNAARLAAAAPADRAHEERRGLFEQWPSLLRKFLAKPDDPSALGRLMRQAQDPAWPAPMDEERALDLAERLLGEASRDANDDRPVTPRPEGVVPEDLRLAFSEDINPQLVDAFLHEAPQHVNRLSRSIQRIANNDASVEDVIQAQRVAHTVKGSANITGIVGIANLTHRMEDILEFLAGHEQLPPRGLGDALLDASDCLEAMVEHLLGLGAPPEHSVAVLQRLLEWSERIEIGEYEAEEAEDDTATVPLPSPDTAPVTAPVSVALETAEPAPARAAADADGAALRVALHTIDELLRLAGEMAISIVQIQGRHQRTLAQVNAVTEQNALVRQRLGELQDIVELRGVPAARRALVDITGPPDDDFDPLELDEYSELHSATNVFAEALTDVRELTDILRNELVGLDAMVVQNEQISSELNEVVLSARLIPVATVVPRLQRGVRQTCRATGKRARLGVSGADMQVDSEILTSIVDPLMHIVRNAVDHGIEFPSERVANGKDEHGTIELSFSREGENLVIRCQDDGGGFDFLRIRELAVAQGLVAGDHHMSDSELARLTLVPGFTTRRGTTHVSGRGIGMDVVHRSILELRGSMDIESEPVSGSTIRLRVPLTLISMHVLLVRVGTRIFGVPSSILDQALFSDAGPVVHADVDWIFRFADTDYELNSLSALVGLPGPAVSTLAERVAPLLLVRGDTGPAGITVDELVDGRYLVVKRLGAYVPRIRGVIGASILADGSVAPVLDLQELLRQPAAPLPEAVVVVAEEIDMDLPNVLVVDDSLSARRTLAQVITDAGFVARTAVDGLDAIDAIEERMPDLILVDLEMPRMNGLELASHLRADDATRDIPLVMVTSRSTAKHREQAHAAGIDAFITKPYLDEELAEQIRILISPR